MATFNIPEVDVSEGPMGDLALKADAVIALHREIIEHHWAIRRERGEYDRVIEAFELPSRDQAVPDRRRFGIAVHERPDLVEAMGRMWPTMADQLGSGPDPARPVPVVITCEEGVTVRHMALP